MNFIFQSFERNPRKYDKVENIEFCSLKSNFLFNFMQIIHYLINLFIGLIGLSFFISIIYHKIYLFLWFTAHAFKYAFLFQF